MVKITESAHYEVFKEYEAVLLRIKSLGEIVLIGDFYGDVNKVIISSEERWCIMAGCGIIVYELKAPYTPYEYIEKGKQWKEWYRDGDIWIEDIVLENDDNLVFRLDTGERKEIDINGD